MLAIILLGCSEPSLPSTSPKQSVKRPRSTQGEESPSSTNLVRLVYFVGDLTEDMDNVQIELPSLFWEAGLKGRTREAAAYWKLREERVARTIYALEHVLPPENWTPNTEIQEVDQSLLVIRQSVQCHNQIENALAKMREKKPKLQLRVRLRALQPTSAKDADLLFGWLRRETSLRFDPSKRTQAYLSEDQLRQFWQKAGQSQISTQCDKVMALTEGTAGGLYNASMLNFEFPIKGKSETFQVAFAEGLVCVARAAISPGGQEALVSANVRFCKLVGGGPAFMENTAKASFPLSKGSTVLLCVPSNDREPQGVEISAHDPDDFEVIYAPSVNSAERRYCFVLFSIAPPPPTEPPPEP